jgi:hypothetical protein
MRKLFTMIIFLSAINPLFSQSTVTFSASFSRTQLVLGESYKLTNSNDSISFNKLKFYISNVKCFQDSQLIGTPTKQHYLIDYSDTNTCTIKFDNKFEFNRIEFDLGIDSLVNNAGAQGGDLDPTMGMYWSWQSGYINFKLEGTCSAVSTRNNKIQYHIGGYKYPYNTLRSVNLRCELSNNATISLAIEKLIEQIEIEKLPKVMSPNANAILVADYLRQIFSLSN